jgi:uncharacterized protein YciI
MSLLRLALILSVLALGPAARAQAVAAQEKLFIVHFTTGPAWDPAKPPQEQAHFREHSANLNRLRREGLLLIGARYGDKGMIVLRAADEAAVHAQLQQDPSVAAGTFAAQVDPFRTFMHGSTNYLTTPEAVVLRAYYDAFNLRDAAATAALCAEDVRWFTVDGDKVAPEASGRGALQEWLAGYFKSLPTVRSEVLSLEQAGAHLTVRERVSWDNAAGRRVSQQALGVYEVRDGLIRRVWYFPSVKDAHPAR